MANEFRDVRAREACPQGVNRRAFEAVYRAHVDFVRRSVRRLGIADAWVDDTTQEVFMVVGRRLHEFRGDAALRTWLFAITRRVVQTQRRTHYRHARKVDALARSEMTSSPAAVDGPATIKARRELLLNLLGCLSPQKREVFILAELEGMSAAEISAALDIKETTVYSRLRTARLELLEAVARLRRAEGGTT